MSAIVKYMTYLIKDASCSIPVQNVFVIAQYLPGLKQILFFDYWVYKILLFVYRSDLGVTPKQHWVWGAPLQTDLPRKKSGGWGAGGAQQLALDGI